MAAMNKLHMNYSANETIEGRDMIVEAPSTTGKTYALCISALQIIDTDIKTCQALILTYSPYDEKVLKFTADMSQFMQVNCLVHVGRDDIDDDLSALRDGQQFVVGTPSRVLELIQLDAIKIDSIRLLAVDDADNILVRERFTKTILAIHQHMPDATQVVVVSAKMRPKVLEIATKLLRNPLHIIVSNSGRPLHNLKQVYMAVEKEEWKLDILSHFGDVFGVAQAVVLCNTHRTLEWLVKEFSLRGITTSTMHYDIPPLKRAVLLDEFRSGSTATLLAPNMLAHGLDRLSTSLIVNYELPTKYEDYYHRTSSRGRFAPECITVNLVTAAEVCKVHDIEHFYNTKIEEMPIPFQLRSQLSAE
jgi:superfamily II DNA/RNA helicase